MRRYLQNGHLMTTENLTHPGADPVDGDLIRITYANGSTEEKQYVAPVPAVPAPVAQHTTKRSFQNRFPKLANGISTKYDAMCLFLTDDGYAASLGVTGAPLYELRMLITTGMQRMAASPFVDMTPGAEADAFTALLTQGFIPSVFKLSAEERSVLMTTPLTEAERYKG